MRDLTEGYERFRHDALVKYRRLFETLAREGQHPRALFITCADSRLTPHLLTDAQPGDLFVLRNIGNIVPPRESCSHSVGAAIEYAVLVLRVPHIVICGHTQCGAMQALLENDFDESAMPHLCEWLRHTAALPKPTPPLTEDCVTRLAEENVRLGLKNLLTYPPVLEALRNHKLQLHGWMFHIATAEITVLDSATGLFRPLDQPHPHQRPSDA